MKKLYGILLGLSLLLFVNSVSAQVLVCSNDTFLCAGSVTLSANWTGPQQGSNPTQIQLSDDQFSGIIPIGFSFTYYGQNYTQCLIASNNYISFDLSSPGGYSPWPITNPVPNAGNPLNAIMGPWQDINPGTGGIIRYQTQGTQPNRIFIVEYCNVPMFSCTQLQFTTQIKLFEGTNIIESHITNKPICGGWNSGRAIHATHNNVGTIAHVVPGRNSPSQWAANNEGYRWTPNGNNAYTIAQIPYLPSVLGNVTQIQWRIAGSQVVIGTGPTLTVSPSSTTIYVASLQGQSCNSLTYRDTVVVNIVPLPITASNDTTVCPGANVPLWVTGNFVNPTFSWSGGPVANPNAQNTTCNPTQTTTYTVTVTDGPCVVTEQVTVNVIPLPVVAMPDTAICIGASIPLTVSGNFVNPSFVWAPANTLNNPTSSSPIATPTQTTPYVVTVTDGPCSNSDTVVVTLIPLPVISVNPPAPFICPTGNVQLTASGAAAYVWAPPVGLSSTIGPTTTASPTVQTTYTVTGVDMNGCINDTTVTVSIYVPGQVTITPGSWDMCPGQSVQLTASGSGTYQWDPPIGLNNTNTNTVTAQPAQTQQYQVIGTDGNGCLDTTVVNVTINPLPSPNIGAAPISGCQPLMVNFSDQSSISTGNIAAWQWYFENNGNSNSAAPYVGFSHPGQFDVKLIVTSNKGCKDSITIADYITVYANPEADFNYTPETTSTASPEVQFFDKSSSNVITWDWTFAGLGIATGPNPTYSFNQVGEYPVILTVTTEHGCTDEAYGLVVVENISELFIPNTFTPNGDGLNETFFPIATSYGNNFIEVHIFDRWGFRVYMGTDYNKPWKGNIGSSDTEAPPGVYAYKVIYKNEKAKEFVYTGNLNLIR